MTTTSVTVRTVQALQPGETIWDADHREAVRGFGVRRQRGSPVYVVKYRIFGKQRFLTIGPHGSPWTPERARKEAKRVLGLVADGKDPADEKNQAALQAADTLRRIAEEYLKHAKQKQRPKTYSETQRYLLGDWKSLHSVSVFRIRRRDVAARIVEIATAQGPVAATRARAALSAMFNWAIRDGLDIPANPVTGTNRPARPQSRERVLTDGELKAIWLACGDDDYGRIVRLLILTAQRRDEVGAMRWTELAGNAWTIPGQRTKNHREHTVPLSPQALTLIEAQSHRNDRDFIFGDGPRRLGDTQRGFSGWSKAKAALDERIVDAQGKPLPAWTIHDLRRTAATMMADKLGVLPHIIEAVLNHISGHRAGVAGVYNRARYEAEMRAALCAWGDYVEGLGAVSPPKPKSLRLVRRT